MRFLSSCALFLLSLTLVIAIGACSKSNPELTLNKYWGELAKSNLEKVNSYWARANDNRYYADWHFAPPEDTLIKYYLNCSRLLSPREVSEKHAIFDVVFTDSANQKRTLTYHLTKLSGWKLENPVDYYCAEWEILDLGDLTIFAPSGKMPGPDFFESLKSMFAHTKSMLGVEDLTPIKIYLAQSPTEVQKLSGSSTQRRMWFYPAAATLIFAYQDRPLPPNMPLLQARQIAVGLVPILALWRYGHDSYEVPIMKYGLAVYFWGADGYTAEMVRLLAAQSGRLDSLPDFTSLFEKEIFHSDISFYSVVGSLIVEFIVKNYGWSRFHELYSASNNLESFRSTMFPETEIGALRERWRLYIEEFLKTAREQEGQIKKFASSNRYRRR